MFLDLDYYCIQNSVVSIIDLLCFPSFKIQQIPHILKNAWVINVKPLFIIVEMYVHSTIFKIHHTYLGLNLPILNEDVDLVNGGKDGDEVGGKVVGENGAKDSSKNGLG